MLVDDTTGSRTGVQPAKLGAHIGARVEGVRLGGFARRIVGVSGAESAALLRLFQDRVTRLEHTVRWDWALGDVAIWDNRATQHCAVDDYDGRERRTLTRITLAGAVPAGASGLTRHRHRCSPRALPGRRPVSTTLGRLAGSVIRRRQLPAGVRPTMGIP